MKALFSLFLSALLILPGPTLLLVPLQSGASTFVLKPIDPNRALPTFYAIDIPWHYQELGYSCGPACLKMAFGCHGWDIEESEIRNVANTTLLHGGTITSDLVRAAHFSNASNSCGDPSIQGYSKKWYGCDSVPLLWSANSEEETEEISTYLKEMLVHEKTLILLMWYTNLKRYGHYRVLRGYDDREGVFVFSDPLLQNAHSGSQWNTTYESLYTEYWEILPFYAQLVSPWTVSLSFSQNPSPSGTFEVRAIIDSGIKQDWRYYPFSETTATLTLPSAYELVTGNKEVNFQLDSDGQATVSWQVNAPTQVAYSDSISVFVSGSLSAKSYSYESYTDIIGAEDSLSVTDGVAPSISDVSMIMEQESVRFAADISDESELRKVEIKWRKNTANWSYVSMNHLENNIWESSKSIPFLPDNEIIQVCIISEDMYNNTAETQVLEVAYDEVSDNRTLILLGVVIAVVVITIIIIVWKKRH